MKTRAALTAALIAVLLTLVGAQHGQRFDVLIRNGRVMDGTGNPWFPADIGILNGRSIPSSDGGVLCGVLDCGGLLHESSKGSALFTLSLPVTHRQLVGARSGTGLAQLFAIAMVPPLAIPILAPSIGQHLSFVDALARGLCIFFVGAVFFSLASFLSTLFADIRRPMLIAIGVACLPAFSSFAIPQLRVFSVMSGESYFRTGARS
jgi:ABC-type transport system involved in multi-copper enzyme maturation permease subunit